MIRRFLLRFAWACVVLADTAALVGLFELIDPKEQSVAYVWNRSYNWLSLTVGLASIALIIAAVSIFWMTTDSPRQAQHSFHKVVR